MDRRNWVGALGALAAAGWASQARGQGHEHHAGHAAPGGKPRPYAALQAAAADCTAKGQTCLSHCLVLLGEGDKSVADCARTVNQVLALCGALQSLAAQGAALTPAAARVALDACKQCADACTPHVEHHAECKACRDACLECATQCKAVI